MSYELDLNEILELLKLSQEQNKKLQELLEGEETFYGYFVSGIPSTKEDFSFEEVKSWWTDENEELLDNGELTEEDFSFDDYFDTDECCIFDDDYWI